MIYLKIKNELLFLTTGVHIQDKNICCVKKRKCGQNSYKIIDFSEFKPLFEKINDNSPYTIQEYIERSPDNVLIKGIEYEIDVLLSIISDDFEIKYLTISSNKRFKLKQYEYNK